MSIYIAPIQSAIFIFTVAALVIMVPAMIIQYRNYGSVSTRRSLILYGFLFYMIAAYCLVILPLPAKDSVTTSYRDMMQLVPFSFINDFFKETVLVISDPSTYLRALIQSVVIQPVFNVFLTVPFGMFLKYYFNKSLKQTIMFSLLLSLFFEITQLSGLFFIYAGPYRLFDVDDLILNTFGGFLGYFIAPSIQWFFPSREELDTLSYVRGQDVSYVRRFLAYSVDMVFIKILVFLISVPLYAKNVNAPEFLIEFILFLFYFGVLPVAQHKGTLGQRLVKIKIVYNVDTKWRSMISRTVLVFLTVNLNKIVFDPLWYLVNASESLYVVGIFFLLSLQFLSVIFLSTHILYTSRKGHHMFYDLLSKTQVVNTIDVDAKLSKDI